MNSAYIQNFGLRLPSSVFRPLVSAFYDSVLFKYPLECPVIRGHAGFFELAVLLQKRLALRGQACAVFAVLVHDLDLQMLFRGFNLAPGGFVGHVERFGGLVDGTGAFDAIQDGHAAFTHHDAVFVVNDPVA